MPTTEEEDVLYNMLGHLVEYLPAEYQDKDLQSIPAEILTTAYNTMMANTVDRDVISAEMKDRVANLAFLTSGAGPYFNQIQTFLTCLDRFKGNILPVNTVESGLTLRSSHVQDSVSSLPTSVTTDG